MSGYNGVVTRPSAVGTLYQRQNGSNGVVCCRFPPGYCREMLAPWKTHPNIQPRSMGWRMGIGEDYLDQFNEWFERKHLDAKQQYAAENPEPSGWEGFYQRRGVRAD